MQELFQMLTVEQVDAAVDRAAKAVSATVALFMAAPSAPMADGAARIEFAIEFFVPAAGLAAVEEELDRALMRQSTSYAAARKANRILRPKVLVVPAGTFHQWQLAWRGVELLPIRQRWTADRSTICSLMRHVETGWRELLAI